MTYNLRLPSGPEFDPSGYFQMEFPEGSLRISRRSEGSTDYEAYEEEILNTLIFMKKYFELISEHPELAVPSEHTDFGGCDNINPNIIVETSRVVSSEDYSRLWALIADNYPSQNVSPLSFSQGGFSLEVIEEAYCQDYLS